MFQRPMSHARPAPNAAELSEARFKRFLKDMDVYERKLTFERTLDSFLDLYSQWRRTHDEQVKLRLVMLVFELHRLDSHFECDLSFAEHA